MIRDAMLAISGQLNATPFGPYVATQQTAVGEVVVDPQDAGARRRSVYLQQRRSQTLSMLKVFDAPAIATVCTTRPSSTVPLQSLSLLNSDFAVATAEAFARRLLQETDGTDAALIQRRGCSRSLAHRPPTSSGSLPNSLRINGLNTADRKRQNGGLPTCVRCCLPATRSCIWSDRD